jgi:hypothetical protein
MTRVHVAYRAASREEPASDVRADAVARVLSRITDPDWGIAIRQHPVDAVVHTRAAALAAREPSELRPSPMASQLAHDAVAAITAKCGAPNAMQVLLGDIRRLAGRFAAIASRLDTGRAITLRLEIPHDGGFRRFHPDRVRLRLLSSHLGPVTEWLTDDRVEREAPAGHLPHEAILRRGEPQRLEPFRVAILEGDRDPGSAGRRRMHRSAPIAAAKTVRPLFCLDI